MKTRKETPTIYANPVEENAFLREVERRAGEPLARLHNYVRMKSCPCSGCEWLARILGEKP